MLLDSCSLPFDVWSAILDFLQVSDLYGLVATNKEIRSIVDQDNTYERLAKHKFPLQLLDITHYENDSWKKLLQDDNAKNGYYRLELNNVSYCSREGIAWGTFYVNKIRSIAWDRQENHIILEVEAFGENDLRAASATSIFRFDPENGAAVLLAKNRIDWRQPQINHHGGGGRESHQLCRIHLATASFPPGYSYKFTYNGGSDYDCITFLSKSQFPSLPELFDLQREQGLHGGKLGRCEFVSRSAPLVPSNVTEWEGVLLPQDIKERHRCREWGAFRPT